jgi:hypothetical protein
MHFNVALAVPADGNGNIDGRNAGVENHHAPHLVELFAGGAVRSCRGRLYRRHVSTPEKNPPAAIVQAIETVVAKDAVFISRACEARILDGFRSGVARLRNQVIAGGTFFPAATCERAE